MKVLVLFIVAFVSMACLSHRNQQSLSEDVQAILDKIPTTEEASRNRDSKTYPETFLVSYKDYRICPSSNLEFVSEVNAKVKNMKYIERENKRLGYKHELFFVGKEINDSINPFASKYKSAYLTYEIMILDAKDKESLTYMQKKYPGIIPPKDLDCLNCNNSKDPIMAIYSNTEPREFFHLTRSENEILTFSSKTGKIILIPEDNSCP